MYLASGGYEFDGKEIEKVNEEEINNIVNELIEITKTS